MSDLFWRRVSKAFGLLAIGVLFGILTVSSHVEMKDLDIWLHIGVGRFIVQNFYVPGVDILSHTVAGTLWVNHEWLFQVLVYILYQGWGVDGLIWMQVMVVFFTFLLLLLLGYNSEKQFMTILSLLFVLLLDRKSVV